MGMCNIWLVLFHPIWMWMLEGFTQEEILHSKFDKWRRMGSEILLGFYKKKRTFPADETLTPSIISVTLLILYSHWLIHRRRVIRILKTTVFRRSTRSPVTIRDTRFTIGSEDSKIAKVYSSDDLQLQINSSSSWYEPGCRPSSQRGGPLPSSETQGKDQMWPPTASTTLKKQLRGNA